jgi:biotin transport system substrate-specific component
MVNTNGGNHNQMIRLVLSAAMAVLTAITAQIKFNIGPVPYTMQNFGVILSGLLLGPMYGAISQLIYLGMIAIGLPVASGFKGGIGILFGYTAGYLWMFPVAAFIAGLIRKVVWKAGSKIEMFLVWLGSCIAVIPVYLVGFYVFYSYATKSAGLMGWCEKAIAYFGLHFDAFWTVFFTSAVIFLPQDFFVDHVLAVAAFAYLVKLLKQKGITMDV